MRVVVDTNVWVSAVLAPDGFCAPLLDRLREDDFQIVACPAMLRDLTVVLQRPRIAQKYRLTPSTIARVVVLLLSRAESMPDPPILAVSRDPRDDVFVAAAVASKADYLVTRDDDLKRDSGVQVYLSRFGVQVQSVREFLETLDSAL